MTLSVLRKAPPWLDRVLSLVAAGLLLFVAYRWLERARELADVCGARGWSDAVCSEVAAPLPGLQFALAIAGIVVTLLLAALALFQAATGRPAPLLRSLVVVLAVIAAAWFVVYLLGWL